MGGRSHDADETWATDSTTNGPTKVSTEDRKCVGCIKFRSKLMLEGGCLRMLAWGCAAWLPGTGFLEPNDDERSYRPPVRWTVFPAMDQLCCWCSSISESYLVVGCQCCLCKPQEVSFLQDAHRDAQGLYFEDIQAEFCFRSHVLNNLLMFDS